jgi:hypothetical protein
MQPDAVFGPCSLSVNTSKDSYGVRRLAQETVFQAVHALTNDAPKKMGVEDRQLNIRYL